MYFFLRQLIDLSLTELFTECENLRVIIYLIKKRGKPHFLGHAVVH